MGSVGLPLLGHFSNEKYQDPTSTVSIQEQQFWLNSSRTQTLRFFLAGSACACTRTQKKVHNHCHFGKSPFSVRKSSKTIYRSKIPISHQVRLAERSNLQTITVSVSSMSLMSFGRIPGGTGQPTFSGTAKRRRLDDCNLQHLHFCHHSE